MNINEMIQKLKEEAEKFKNSPDIQTLKLIDKRILIPVGIVIFLIIIFYYYYIFIIYPKPKNPLPSQPPTVNRNLKNPQISYGNVSIKSEQGLEVKKVLNEFFWYISNRDFAKAFEYFEPNFIKSTNLTLEEFSDYYEFAYPQHINYEIKYITAERPGLYSVRLSVNNADPTTDNHFLVYQNGASYCIIKDNDTLKLYTDDIIDVSSYIE